MLCLGCAIMLFAVYELAGTFHNAEATAFATFMLAFCSVQTIIACEVPHSAAHKVSKRFFPQASNYTNKIQTQLNIRSTR
jgi:hypothetical protein